VALFKDEAYDFDSCGDAHLILNRRKGLTTTIWFTSIADIEFDDNVNAILVIRNADTGEPTKSFAMPAGFSLPWNSPQWILRWTPDGKTLTYALWRGPGSPTNLWSQSVAGGPPRQITNFPDSVIAYDWSPDGKQLAYTRYASISDVVQIGNFR
jgi:Tol biopolymer transport system component